MILVDLIVWSIFTYLVYIVIYRFIIIVNSSKGRIIDIDRRKYLPEIKRKLTVLIYSRNNSTKAKSLIESFSRQTYDKEKFSVNIILDNCDHENIKLLEILGGARLWRINTNVKPIGKYKSFTWLIDRIRAVENTNAFVFLDAECIIKTDFLEKINASLNENVLIAGETVKRKKYFLNKLLNLKNKINNRVFRHGRFYSGLGNVIDADVFVIKQDILEKINFETNDYGFEEYEYPIKLKSCNIPVYYSNDIIVHKNQAETIKTIALKEYKERYRAFKTFINNFNLLFSKNEFSVKEQVLSLTYPSNITFAFWNIMLIMASLSYPNTIFSKTINLNILLLVLFLRVISDIYALILMRSNFNDYNYAFLSFLIDPVIYLRSIFVGFSTAPAKSKEKPGRHNLKSLSFEKNIVEATITNGKSEFPCTLEISKSDEYSSVTFVFKDKKLNSSKQPRVCYAIEEIVDKLKTHGFSLKVCSNCGYFHLTEASAAHTEGVQGYCLYKNYKEDSKEKEYTPAWSSCKKIIPAQARNYIRQEMGLEKN